MNPATALPPDPNAAAGVVDPMATLKAAVTGGTQVGSPDSPLGNYPEIAKLYSSRFQLPLSNANTAVQANNDALTVKNQQAQADFKQQQEQDMANPSKYKQVPEPGGGYTFYAPNGQKISASIYAHITGQDLGKVLSGSDNPVDQVFSQDYQNLQTYLNAKRNAASSPQDAAKAKQIEDTVFKQSGGKVDLSKEKPTDITTQFQHAYPEVFGLQGNNNSNSVTIPALQTGSTSSQLIAAALAGGNTAGQ